jgi:hypothetical protein
LNFPENDFPFGIKKTPPKFFQYIILSNFRGAVQ